MRGHVWMVDGGWRGLKHLGGLALFQEKFNDGIARPFGMGLQMWEFGSQCVEEFIRVLGRKECWRGRWVEWLAGCDVTIDDIRRH